VDGETKYIHCCHQETGTGKETVQSKRNTEQFACSHNVHFHHYRCDNSIYQSKKFRQEIIDNKQSQLFTGISTCWQNGLAERYISALTCKARIMLLHAMAHLPAVITKAFWSYVYKLAAHQHNHLPSRKSSTTPNELFTMEESSDETGCNNNKKWRDDLF
jgi:transposase InsO family protein